MKHQKVFGLSVVFNNHAFGRRFEKRFNSLGFETRNNESNREDVYEVNIGFNQEAANSTVVDCFEQVTKLMKGLLK